MLPPRYSLRYARDEINLVKARKGSAHAPKHIKFATELPMTGIGKVDKKLLRAGIWVGRDRMVSANYFRGKNSGHIARQILAADSKSFGPVSWHSAFSAGSTHGCALLMYICATGTSQVVSSNVPARTLTDCGRPTRSP